MRCYQEVNNRRLSSRCEKDSPFALFDGRWVDWTTTRRWNIFLASCFELIQTFELKECGAGTWTTKMFLPDVFFFFKLWELFQQRSWQEVILPVKGKLQSEPFCAQHHLLANAPSQIKSGNCLEGWSFRSLDLGSRECFRTWGLVNASEPGVSWMKECAAQNCGEIPCRFVLCANMLGFFHTEAIFVFCSDVAVWRFSKFQERYVQKCLRWWMLFFMSSRCMLCCWCWFAC